MSERRQETRLFPKIWFLKGIAMPYRQIKFRADHYLDNVTFKGRSPTALGVDGGTGLMTANTIGLLPLTEAIMPPEENLTLSSYYHLYNRGINRQPIFFCDENWGYFIRRVRHYFLPELVVIVAYCLMPTHYHLLVYLRTDDLSRQIMQPFSLSYTKAINKQQGRVGSLFQGPFQATWIDRDEYLLHLSRYIHLNPVAAGLVERPDEWAFSSYRDYIGLRQGTLPVPDAVLSQFPSRRAYQTFVESYDDQRTEIIEHLLFDEKD